MITFSHGVSTPQPSGEVLSEMQSSPARMSQSEMRTLRERSTSMPSLLGMSMSLTMWMLSMPTSSQPRMRTVQKAPSRIVRSRIRTRRQFLRWTVNGRWWGQT